MIKHLSFFIYMTKCNKIIKYAIDTEVNRYDGLTNMICDLEFQSNMRRYGESKNNFRFRNSLLYLGIVEETLKCIQNDSTKL